VFIAPNDYYTLSVWVGLGVYSTASFELGAVFTTPVNRCGFRTCTPGRQLVFLAPAKLTDFFLLV
jgi:hypothetical protein